MSERQAASSRPAPLASQGKLLNGRYRCLEQLGSGGMGVVYRAYDAVQQREVALKQLQVGDVSAQRRSLVETLFAREYHTLVRLRHPRIIEVYEYGRSEEGRSTRWSSCPDRTCRRSHRCRIARSANIYAMWRPRSRSCTHTDWRTAT